MARTFHSQIPNPSMQPVILSMEVDDDDACESECRVRVGSKVKYIIIFPKTSDRDTLSSPSVPAQSSLRQRIRISRDEARGELKTSFSNRILAGVKCQWHDTRIACLKLRNNQAAHSVPHSTRPSSTAVIAKLACFDLEIPRIEQETRAYQLLEVCGLAPHFVGHVHENGRVMGFDLEKIEGRPASFQDLGIWASVKQRSENITKRDL